MELSRAGKSGCNVRGSEAREGSNDPGTLLMYCSVLQWEDGVVFWGPEGSWKPSYAAICMTCLAVSELVSYSTLKLFFYNFLQYFLIIVGLAVYGSRIFGHTRECDMNSAVRCRDGGD